jgi:hypothetical protein
VEAGSTTDASASAAVGASAGAAVLADCFGAGVSAGASAGAAVAFAASRASPYVFLNFISTGSSIVEEALLTNSPISFSLSRTSLLSMP